MRDNMVAAFSRDNTADVFSLSVRGDFAWGQRDVSVPIFPYRIGSFATGQRRSA